MNSADAAEQLDSTNSPMGRQLPWDEPLTAQHQQLCCESLRGLLYTDEQAVALLGKEN